mgnify:CR=1 FL=1
MWFWLIVSERWVRDCVRVDSRVVWWCVMWGLGHPLCGRWIMLLRIRWGVRGELGFIVEWGCDY